MDKIIQIPIQPQAQKSTQITNPITELVKIMQSVDVTKPETQLNETSVSDGKGGRIELNNDKTLTNDLEK